MPATDLQLHIRSLDVDWNEQDQVYLNGQFLGYLSTQTKKQDDQYKTTTFFLDPSLLLEGDNLVVVYVFPNSECIYIDWGQMNVETPPPVADAGGPYYVDEGDSITLDAGASTGAIQWYDWDFNNDGIFDDASGKTPSFTGLDGPDEVTVNVKASNNLGESSISSATVYVSNVAPTANPGGPYQVEVGHQLTLNGSATDPAGALDPLTYQWDFNYDGVTFDVDATGAAPSFDATGWEDGLYTIALLVDDGDGGSHLVTTQTTVFVTLSGNSDGYPDGWVLERAEPYEIGYLISNRSAVLNIGDDRADRQYKTILSFDSTALPADAVVIGMRLQVRSYSTTGAPFANGLGALQIELKDGFFYNTWRLERQDFEANADYLRVSDLAAAPGNGEWLSFYLDDLPEIQNNAGYLQLRLAFEVGDNDNYRDDYWSIYGGYSGSSAPVLIVEYYVP